MSHRTLVGLVTVLSFCAIVSAAPPEDRIELKSGKVIHGRVVAKETVRKIRMLKIETDFGVIRVPANKVRRAPRVGAEPAPGVFFFNRIRVAQIRGNVEKRAAGSPAWQRIRLREDYGAVLNKPDAIVKPGDTVRATNGGFIDLQPHKDVWVRITDGAVVEFPAERGPASMIIRSGVTLQRINGKPRGKTFVIQTPTRRISVGGTEFLVEVGRQERVAVTQGEVEVEGGAGAQKVTRKKTGIWNAGDKTSAIDIGQIDSDDVEALKVDDVRLPEEDMVYVPSGKYRMGGGGAADAPMRKITLSGYMIDRREVTNEEFARYVKATGRGAPAHFQGGKPPAGQERHPVYGLTEDMARSYAAWAGKKLPTEAQWEAAARGPKALAFPWGNDDVSDPKALPSYTQGGPFQEQSADLQPVDKDTPDISPFGIRGMASSVPEWCRDFYDPGFYAKGKDKDPQGPSGGIFKVVRGAERDPSKRRRTATDDDKAGVGVRGVVEPD